MISNITYDFKVDRDNRMITIKREFAADIKRVWEAFTKSEILDQWWAPSPWKTNTREMVFGEGGRWLYSMNGPEGEEHWAVAQFREIRPLQSFTVSDAFSDNEGNIKREMPRSEWTVNFTDQGNHTTIVIADIQYDSLEDLEGTLNMGFQEGLAMAFENLDRLLHNA